MVALSVLCRLCSGLTSCWSVPTKKCFSLGQVYSVQVNSNRTFCFITGFRTWCHRLQGEDFVTRPLQTEAFLSHSTDFMFSLCKMKVQKPELNVSQKKYKYKHCWMNWRLYKKKCQLSGIEQPKHFWPRDGRWRWNRAGQEGVSFSIKKQTDDTQVCIALKVIGMRVACGQVCVCVCQTHHAQYKNKEPCWLIFVHVNLSPLLISAEKWAVTFVLSRTLCLIYTEQLHECSFHLRTEQMSAGFKSSHFWHANKDL